MEAAQHPWPALGVLLVRDGLVSKDELESILEEQSSVRHPRVSGYQLGEILVARGAVTPVQIARLVAEQYELPFLELETTDIDVRVARLLREEMAQRLHALPVSTRTDGSYVLAIADPATVLFSDELRSALGATAHFVVVGPEAIDAAIAFAYDSQHDLLAAAVSAPDDDDQQGVVVELRSGDSTTAATLDHDLSFDIPTVAHHGPPLGALLLRAGLVTEDELERALAQQTLSTSWRLGEILIDRGVVTPAVVARLIAEQYELPYTELDDLHVEPHVAALLPYEIAREFPAVPITAHPDGSLVVAIADPTNVRYADELHDALGVALTFVVSSPDAIDALLETVHAPVAIVELVADDEEASVESEGTFDQAESMTAEDVEELVDERDDLPEFVIEPIAHEEVAAVTEAAAAEEVVAADDESLDITGEDVEELVDEREDLPEFVVEPLALEEAVAITEIAAVEELVVADDEAVVVEENFRWRPVWMTDFQPADDSTEIDATEDDPVAAPEAIGTDADELAAVLLTEAAEIQHSPEPAVDPEQEISLALVEIERAFELTEVDTVVEPTQFEPTLALVEFEGDDDLESALVDDPAESEAEPEKETPTTTLGEADNDEELFETAMVDEAAEPEEAIAHLDVDFLNDATDLDSTESTDRVSEPEDLAVEDPSAYADDLDAAIDEVLALGASAIHFSPQGEWHTVRARIDGLVRELGVVAKDDLESLVERVQASAAMRVDVIPTKQGTKVVLFPRERAGSPRVLAELGLTGDAADALHSALSLPSGAIVVCGPVGSGTTTTLYAALEALNTPDRVLASIENPVERVLDGVDQTEVDLSSDITFSDGLRTLFSTDSDIVLVGEIRDQEAAEVALQAAVDGRQILAGMRSPSAAAAIRRLAEMGIEPSVLGGALACVVSQRLVRQVCADCRETYYASESELVELGQSSEGNSPRLLARGRGCDSCDGTGFRGRIGLFEILSVTDEIRALVCDGASVKKIHRAAVAAGMKTLRDDGVRLCLEGITTAAEVQRVLGIER